MLKKGRVVPVEEQCYQKRTEHQNLAGSVYEGFFLFFSKHIHHHTYFGRTCQISTIGIPENNTENKFRFNYESFNQTFNVDSISSITHK